MERKIVFKRRNGIRETLLSTINDELLVLPERKLYLGEFYDISDDPQTKRQHFLFQRKGIDRDLLGDVSFYKERTPILRMGLDSEYADLHFFSKGLKLKVRPYQITDSTKLTECIEKGDWVSPDPLTIYFNGDYTKFIDSIKKSVEDYKQDSQNSSFFIDPLT